MVSLIRIFQDNTYIRKKRRIQDNKVLVSKKENYSPEITMGKSVFKERKPRWKFWRGGRDIAILLDGCPKVLSLDPPKTDEDKPVLNLQFGTREDTNRYIAKIVAKDKAEQKQMTNIQFIVIAMLLGINLVLQFMSMRGVTV